MLYIDIITDDDEKIREDVSYPTWQPSFIAGQIAKNLPNIKQIDLTFLPYLTQGDYTYITWQKTEGRWYERWTKNSNVYYAEEYFATKAGFTIKSNDDFYKLAEFEEEKFEIPIPEVPDFPHIKIDTSKFQDIDIPPIVFGQIPID